MPDDQISHQHQVWEDWAKADPLWAILSEPSRKNGKWDADEFFASGIAEIDSIMAEIADRGLKIATNRCLDFGCGVGRLTQALANVFDRSDGVDISDTMVSMAREYNKRGDRVLYHVNVADDLRLFEDGAFDFIYSTIVLQHNPPDVAESYIREFVRILAPNGLAVFDMPTKFVDHPLPAGSHSAELSVLEAPRQLVAGEAGVARVRVRNTSQHDWPAGSAVRVGNHWRRGRGSMAVLDDGRTQLADGLKSNDSVDVDVPVVAPQQPGKYRLEIDLVEERVCWFADRGSSVATETVQVQEARLTKHRGFRVLPRRSKQAASKDPELFTMCGLPVERVQEAVAQAGGTVVATQASTAGGINWEGFRYFVQR